MRTLELIPDSSKARVGIKLLLLSALMLFSCSLHASWTDNASPTNLASKIQGNGITITNPTLRRGSGQQVGVFSNGIAEHDLEIDEGILLTCMSVAESFTSNNSGQRSIDNIDTTSDPDLLAIDNRAKYDTVVFEFDVTLDSNTRLLLVDYQFASDEYNEYVGSIYNDAFGFFISGGDLNQTYNIARVVDEETYVNIDNINNFPLVTVNNVNNGHRGVFNSGQPSDLNNSAYFIDNCLRDGTTCNFNQVPLNIEYDGITHQLHATLDNLTPGETYHFKMALADTGDSQWDTGVFISKIIGIRAPDVCYDYAYKQNNRVITEQYIEADGPHISGNVFIGSPIDVILYIKNKEESEIKATNVSLSITDINNTQAIYHPQSVYLTYVDTYEKHHLTDNTNGMTVTPSSISNIPIENFDSQDYFYTYYSIDPKVHNLNIPINAMMSYDMVYPITSQQNLIIPKTAFIDKDVPICSDSDFKYNPAFGAFNVEHTDLFASQKYNLPTQVVKRADNFKVVAYDVNSIHQRKDINTTISIELIDAGLFHDINASCNAPSNSISDRIWITFDNNNSANFSASDIINNNLIYNPDAATKFYQTAKENVAFRISYQIGDDNGSVATEEISPGKWKLKNFTVLAGTPCVYPVTTSTYYPNGNLSGQITLTQVPQACGSNGAGSGAGNGMTQHELNACMECIFGSNLHYICSRDNFAIRPESFNIKIDDQSQTDSSVATQRIADDRTGVITPNTDRINLAAGYKYLIDINATDHIGGGPTLGYIRGYSPTTDKEHNLTLIWEPTKNVTCNDTNSSPQKFNIINGHADFNLSHSQVGEYRLNMIDKDWTKVDHDSAYMTHQSKYPLYFYAGKDCNLSSSDVLGVGDKIVGNNSTDLTNINGCLISSEHNHSNSLIPLYLKYRDYNITFHPYSFKLDNLEFSHGGNHDTNFTASPEAYIYISSLARDNNMSLNSIGTISAIGYDSKVLSNYVGGCYARDVNISLDLNNTLPECNPNLFGYQFINLDINNLPITRVAKHFSDDGLSIPIISLSEGNFTKELNGTMNIVINYNYDKNSTSLPLNPKRLELNGLSVGCFDLDECMINANQNFYDYNASKDIIGAINFVYGRVHAPRYRIEGNDGNLTFYYEIYWDGNITCNLDNLFPSLPPLSVDSINWYRNTRHQASDGNITSITKHRGSQSIITTTSKSFQEENIHYNNNSYPYRAVMDINASPWLIYHRFDENATLNSFDVEFNKKGSDVENMTDSNASVNSNRRIMW